MVYYTFQCSRSISKSYNSVIANDNDTKKEMFFYIKGTEPTLNGTTKDLDAVFKEENSLNEQKEAP